MPDTAKGNLLPVSKYGLTARRFDSGSRYPTRANSDIRARLNDTFFYDAFSRDERDAIINRCNSTAGYNGTSGGSDTRDHVFLLSREEARQYFRSDSARRINVTAYAKAQGAYRSNKEDVPLAEPAHDEPSTNWFEDSYEEEGSGDLIAVADEDVNVRTGPGTDYPSVGVMRKGDDTFCYGDSAYDERGVEWYRIDFGGENRVSSGLTHLVMG